MILVIDTDKLKSILPKLLELLRQCEPNLKPAEPEKPEKPIGLPIREYGHYNGSDNDGWHTYYFRRKLKDMPTKFIIHYQNGKTWPVTVGMRTRKPGKPGQDTNDFIVKQSTNPLVGMAILIATRHGPPQGIYVEYKSA